jgi:RNA polymerase-binding protein DksA
MNVEKFRKRLLEEQARLERQLHDVEAQDSASSQQDEQSDLSGYDQHPADAASDLFEREKDLAIEENFKSALEQVVAALQKIEAGTYGTCDRCRKPIAPRRLEVIPYATLCIECAAKIEGTA